MGLLQLDCEGDCGEMQVDLHNALGQRVDAELTWTRDKALVQFLGTPGIYFLTTHGDAGKIADFKLMKR